MTVDEAYEAYYDRTLVAVRSSKGEHCRGYLTEIGQRGFVMLIPYRQGIRDLNGEQCSVLEEAAEEIRALYQGPKPKKRIWEP